MPEFLTRPPWSGKSLLKAFGFSVLVLLSLGIVLALFGLGNGTPVQIAIVGGLAIYCILYLSIWLFVLRAAGIRLADVGFARPSFGTVVRIFFLTLAVLVTEAIVMAFLVSLAGPAPTPSEQILGTNRFQLSAIEGVLLGLLIVVVGPFVEELIFRGLLLRFAAARMPLFLAVVGTSALFAVAHGWTALFIVFFFLGVVLSAVAIRSQNLTQAVLLHGFHNLAGLALILAAA
ncbi:MAG TPA: type II CAAX endopeptidase family protein [Actinomycetota bacterium]|nr:type II CAAX endopeptidase family protein [Actinomycetota bacterium]